MKHNRNYPSGNSDPDNDNTRPATGRSLSEEDDRITILCFLSSGITPDLYDMDGLKAQSCSVMPVISPPRPCHSVLLAGAAHNRHFRQDSTDITSMAGRTEIRARDRPGIALASL